MDLGPQRLSHKSVDSYQSDFLIEVRDPVENFNGLDQARVPQPCYRDQSAKVGGDQDASACRRWHLELLATPGKTGLTSGFSMMRFGIC